jgi:hypothetical protein
MWLWVGTALLVVYVIRLVLGASGKWATKIRSQVG